MRGNTEYPHYLFFILSKPALISVLFPFKETSLLLLKSIIPVAIDVHCDRCPSKAVTERFFFFISLFYKETPRLASPERRGGGVAVGEVLLF